VTRLLPLALAAAFSGAAAADPHVDYMLQCQGCHLPDGGGTPGAVPPLEGVVGSFLAVPGGREFLVRVPGSSQSSLSDARLAAVLNWILESFDPEALGDDFVPFTAEEVARVRRPPLLDVQSVRRGLVSQIEARPGP
jgi:mono/diheme cytochrome c family protein